MIQKSATQVTPQVLVSVVWSFAALGFRHEGLATVAREAFQRQASCLNGQQLVSTAWAFAVLKVNGDGVNQTVAQRVVFQCDRLCAKDLADAAWAFAELAVQDRPAIECLRSAALSHASEFSLQARTGISWSLSELSAPCSIPEDSSGSRTRPSSSTATDAKSMPRRQSSAHNKMQSNPELRGKAGSRSMSHQPARQSRSHSHDTPNFTPTKETAPGIWDPGTSPADWSSLFHTSNFSKSFQNYAQPNLPVWWAPGSTKGSATAHWPAQVPSNMAWDAFATGNRYLKYRGFPPAAPDWVAPTFPARVRSVQPRSNLAMGGGEAPRRAHSRPTARMSKHWHGFEGSVEAAQINGTYRAPSHFIGENNSWNEVPYQQHWPDIKNSMEDQVADSGVSDAEHFDFEASLGNVLDAAYAKGVKETWTVANPENFVDAAYAKGVKETWAMANPENVVDAAYAKGVKETWAMANPIPQQEPKAYGNAWDWMASAYPGTEALSHSDVASAYPGINTEAMSHSDDFVDPWSLHAEAAVDSDSFQSYDLGSDRFKSFDWGHNLQGSRGFNVYQPGRDQHQTVSSAKKDKKLGKCSPEEEEILMKEFQARVNEALRSQRASPFKQQQQQKIIVHQMKHQTGSHGCDDDTEYSEKKHASEFNDDIALTPEVLSDSDMDDVDFKHTLKGAPSGHTAADVLETPLMKASIPSTSSPLAATERSSDGLMDLM
eukprot:gnl/MRDRNA2_/MRDRNA2_101599_c0_seq1.p1 gnl/MRDRNA2_/MRDRNA2_101599_c0~~gnl/MRDRNA2_/MRDRNA2_101599_c0_seq1.p1  ORF type:complete len:726 (+),score=162.89 gnl/MRDRNA2_/MRDRNA2_101599_c0_seq1:30-2180(+)